MDKIGRIFFPTVTALALWDSEVTGQLSDGTWENSRPHDHYKFWFQLEGRVDAAGAPRIELDKDRHMPWEQRTVYNIVGLMNLKWDREDGEDEHYILRGRMLKQARMALALQAVDRPHDSQLCRHAEYMPEEFYSWQASVKSGIWKHDFVEGYLGYKAGVTEAVAAAFYKARYSAKDLREDLKAITAAMRSLPVRG